VPTILLADLSEAQKHAYILADKPARRERRMGSEVGGPRARLTSQKLDIDFDLTVTGLETARDRHIA